MAWVLTNEPSKASVEVAMTASAASPPSSGPCIGSAAVSLTLSASVTIPVVTYSPGTGSYKTLSGVSTSVSGSSADDVTTVAETTVWKSEEGSDCACVVVHVRISMVPLTSIGMSAMVVGPSLTVIVVLNIGEHICLTP